MTRGSPALKRWAIFKGRNAKHIPSLPHESGYKPELQHRAPAKSGFLEQRKNDADRCPFTRLALRLGRAAMQLRYVLYD